MTDNNLMLEFRSPCGRYRLTFEDDGKVAYAYLKHNHAIVGDVWLYNRCPTPQKPEWSDRQNIPFANCAGFMSEAGRLQSAVSVDDVKVTWEYEDEMPVAYIYVFDDLYGVVGMHDNPGYALFAVMDGPLARVMVID